ncbi:MAG: hypothetical protein PHO33_03110 [Clostridia bacterium]|nr:hypothetical protein [Clostridia bacterium]
MNFLLETEAAEEVIVNRFEICDKRELDILRYTSQKLLDSLTYICDEETIKIIQQDLELIDYDVYNADAKKVLNSQLISYYKGQLIIRVDLAFLDDRSFSFGAMYLSTNEKSNEEGVETVMHEYGHYVQLQKLGMNKYIYYIAIPSATNKNPENYYSQPWERTADIFGGITSRSDGYIVNSDIEAYEYLNNAIYNTIFYNIIHSIFNKE